MSFDTSQSEGWASMSLGFVSSAPSCPLDVPSSVLYMMPFKEGG